MDEAIMMMMIVIMRSWPQNWCHFCRAPRRVVHFERLSTLQSGCFCWDVQLTRRYVPAAIPRPGVIFLFCYQPLISSLSVA